MGAKVTSGVTGSRTGAANPLCVLAVDVGNTVTCFGLFGAGAKDRDEPLGTWELTTPDYLTADEARMQVAQVLGILASDVSASGGAGAGNSVRKGEAADFARPPLGSILSCVVPSLVEPWRRALAVACQTRPYVVGPGIKTGIRMAFNDPSEVGPDRIADAVAARELLGAPAIAIDMGTTVNIEVIDAKGAFVGGVIAPGIALGARSLTDATARLPMIELEVPKRVIGKSTREAMLSGVVLGEGLRLDGLVSRIEGELGQSVPVVVTGDDCEAMARLMGHDATVDQTLTLRGLHMLYLTNVDERGRR